MSWKSEFPYFDSELHMLDGWIDNSWHNDICPNIMCRYTNGDTTIEFRIWQECEDADKREYSESDRFTFQVYVNDDVVFYYGSDDWAEMEKLAKGVDPYGWKKEI